MQARSVVDDRHVQQSSACWASAALQRSCRWDYASSTADVFIQGVANAPWLPMVLAGLSLVGIFAGIQFRLRAFLFLGVAFLAVALFSVIWCAAVDLDQTWIWWVTGIVTGIAIIAVFAVFEKKREQVLHLIEKVRTWQ